MKGLLSVVTGILCFFSVAQVSAQCVAGNCYSGTGTYFYPSGAKYSGQFRNGKIHGKGVLVFSNGNRYQGDWVDWYRQGQGELRYANGDVYTGSFRKSKFNGKGVMQFVNGDKYEGDWVEDIQHGKGTYSYNSGNRYVGEFRQGKLDGYGIMYYTDKSRYEGNWSANKKEGSGLFVTTSGKKIHGEWAGGKYIRENQSVASNHSSKPNTSTKPIDSNRNCNTTYCSGGTGIYTYGDGTRYVGDFRQGKPEGEGIVYYPQGDRYEGGWKMHAPHGEGVFYYSNGRVVGGEWAHGRMTKRLDKEEKLEYKPSRDLVYDQSVKIYAVVIGVGNYDHMPKLKFTDDDAHEVYAFLKSPQGGSLPDHQINLLTDSEATKDNILDAMQKTFSKADENDVVLVYFSGHGLPGAFLPVDYDGYHNKLFHEDILEMLSMTKAKHKICLADACHSGTLMAVKSPLDGTLIKLYKAFEQSSGGTALLVSSRGDEYSLEDHGLQQGIFSHFMLKGLKGEADVNSNGIVTVQELYEYVYVEVTGYTGHIQTPMLTGHYDESMPISVVR